MVEDVPPLPIRAILLGSARIVAPVRNASGSEILGTVTVVAHVVWRATTRTSWRAAEVDGTLERRTANVRQDGKNTVAMP